jgi:hypothetical protein
MPIDDDDDLFNEEFDLVDDEFEDDDDYEDDDGEFAEDDSDLAEDTDDESSAIEEAGDEPAAEVAEKAPARAASSGRRKRRSAANGAVAEEEDTDEAPEGEGDELDEYGRPMPTANYVVHIYEYQKFKRTIDRPFTPEDAEAFASEFNRTGKVYGRHAVAGKNDAKPKKSLD